MSLRTLHLIPGLEFTGNARQLLVLGQSLSRDHFEMRVGVLGQEASWAPILEKTGVRVDVLGRKRWFDLAALWNLRRLVRSFQPRLIHAWGLDSLRALFLATGRRPDSLVLSSPFLPSVGGRKISSLDRWLLQGAARLVVRGRAEESRCQKLGLPQAKITCIPPGLQDDLLTSRPGHPGELAPASSPLIACAGALVPHHGFREAIWTFGILHFVFHDLRLWLIGDGPDQAYLDRFARRALLRDRVRFWGPRTDVQGLLAQAALAWVPTLSDGGVHAALEAMLAGRPVLAFDCPSLREIIVDGQTGFLVKRGDKVSLARLSNRLLLEPTLARQMGQSGQDRVRALFSPERLVSEVAKLYRDLAA